MKQKKMILCAYGCFSVSHYIKEVENRVFFDAIPFLDKHVYTKNTYSQSSGIIIILHKY